MGLFTPNPVFDMLKEDHKRVQDLFDEFQATDHSSSKAQIVQKALRELEIHAELEEGLIYPAIRRKIDEETSWTKR